MNVGMYVKKLEQAKRATFDNTEDTREIHQQLVGRGWGKRSMADVPLARWNKKRSEEALEDKPVNNNSWEAILRI
jgi:hypothetical protein